MATAKLPAAKFLSGKGIPVKIIERHPSFSALIQPTIMTAALNGTPAIMFMIAFSYRAITYLTRQQGVLHPPKASVSAAVTEAGRPLYQKYAEYTLLSFAVTLANSSLTLP
jgi:hypothetical protein